jgi:hypothetical protein
VPSFPVDGDLQLTSDGRGFVYATGTAALAQRLKAGLQTPLGTWRWDQTLGVPIFGVEKLTVRILKAFIRRYLLSFDEVVRVTQVDVTADSSGKARVTFSLLAKSGDELTDSVPFQVVNT